MIHISSSLYLVGQGDINANNPRIGYENLIPSGGITADFEETDFPASEIENPATNLLWVSTSTNDQYVYFTLDSAETVNYIGIAGHNFGSGRVTYSLETSADEETWTEVTTERLPANDNAIIHEFDDENNQYWRLKLQPDATVPEIAVVYLGAILRLQRRVYVGHTPITLGHRTNVANNMSESGAFLGRVLLSESLSSSVQVSNLTPSFVRSSLEPFFEEAKENPFFFAWRPGTYPNEVGFAWLTGDPRTSNELANGMMSYRFSINAVA